MANRVELPIVVLNDQAPYNPVSGATAVILNRSDNSSATVYQDSGTTNNIVSQPLSTDSAGRLTGWLNRGAYEVQITIPGRTPYTEHFDAAPASDGAITSTWLANSAVLGANVDSSIKDAASGTPSLRSLGTGSAQAAAGNDSRLSDTRTPTDTSVTTAKLVDGSVTTSKIANAAVTSPQLKPSMGLVRNPTSTNNLGTAIQDISGLSFTVSPTTSSVLEIVASYAFSLTATAILSGFINVDGVDSTSGVATFGGVSGSRGNSTYFYQVSLASGSHTIKGRAQSTVDSSGTALSNCAFLWRLWSA